jgi:hypothetical protein
MTSMPASRRRRRSARRRWSGRRGRAWPPGSGAGRRRRLHRSATAAGRRTAGHPARRPRPWGRGTRRTPRAAAAHSPVVPPAWASAMDAGMMFSSVRATRAARRAPRHGVAWSRLAATRPARRSLRPAPPGRPSGCCRRRRAARGPVSVNLLTPMTICSPDSMRACARRGCARAGPSARRWPRTRRRGRGRRRARPGPTSTSSAVLASITWEPSKMSPYSSRSVSNASTCWMRSDHCWSQGRGRPSASFHAGSCSDRAGVRFDRVTPSASSTMRWMLFSGCASVSPRLFTCTP